jgi:anaerobic selenocysteine-containing dehydrogenase
MQVTRRGFLGGALATGAGIGLLGRRARACGGRKPKLRVRHAKESTTICPYCGVGCGAIVSVQDGKVVNIEGDPDHPINRGSLCSKGSALYQIPNNERRMTKVLYRAPGADRWEEKPWRWAIQRIARLVKDTRDATFQATEGANVVNRTMGIAGLGGASLDNEECHAYSKLARSLGMVYLEHQARI